MENNQYNNLNFSDGPKSIENILLSKGKSIHAQLFNDALNNFACEKYENLSNFLDKYIILKILMKDFWKPCNILIKSKEKPYTLEKIDLSNWWPNYEFTNKSNLSIDSSEKKYCPDEITYIDYVRGYAEVFNRYTGDKKYIDIKNIDDNYAKSDYYKLDNTFTKLGNIL